jgi:hypothetical protein
MRPLLLALVIRSCELWAQPGGPGFCFVLARDQDAPGPLARQVSVVYIARERMEYVGINATYAGPLKELKLEGGALFADSTEGWLKFSPPEQICTEVYVRAVSGQDTMRIDLPTDPTALVQRALKRWDRDSPEVIRFKRGRYVLVDLIGSAWATSAANMLADRLIAEDDASYRKQLAELEVWYKEHPPAPPPPAPMPPPPLMTQERFDSIAATWGSLEKVELEQHAWHLDSIVYVRFTGTITLTGGCASAMPMFGIEQQEKGEWVERMPMQEAQMDCGMPRATWKDQRVGFDLKWWTHTQSREGRGELLPGTYRMVFKGGNLKEVRTEAFQLQ